jgi:hypothetical protein
MRLPFRNRAGRAAAIVALAGLGTATALRTLHSSDHQDTPEVELSPRMDINDVYAFPSKSDPANRIVLVMTTSSPLTPAQSASAAFDMDLLYQLKIDNTGDGIEDLVIQFTASDNTTSQAISMRGPVAPVMIGATTTNVNVAPAVSGPINTVLGDPNGIQLFAGVRDDPFFLDLEQFFCIIPDRKPATGPLALPCATGTPGANGFRPAGSAVDYLNGYNTLAFVVELPKTMLTAGGNAKIGIWGTISR